MLLITYPPRNGVKETLYALQWNNSTSKNFCLDLKVSFGSVVHFVYIFILVDTIKAFSTKVISWTCQLLMLIIYLILVILLEYSILYFHIYYHFSFCFFFSELAVHILCLLNYWVVFLGTFHCKLVCVTENNLVNSIFS